MIISEIIIIKSHKKLKKTITQSEKNILKHDSYQVSTFMFYSTELYYSPAYHRYYPLKVPQRLKKKTPKRNTRHWHN